MISMEFNGKGLTKFNQQICEGAGTVYILLKTTVKIATLKYSMFVFR